MYIVAQAIGTPIAWPKDFVIISEDVTHETPSTSRTKSQRPRAPSTQQPRERRRQQTPPTQLAHTPLERLQNIVSHWDDGECVNLGIESEVFDQDMSHCYIFKDDILQFARKEKIGQAVLVSYMRYISHK
ncbi:uncharacterized protein LOC133807014 [Humulus lupulus]|uniref:uncharacterized protein LOC133807014 n=1 Tax=Humulus lupulus TaxID=3486 RepID=UPI002B405607|nr:uncharacterized protein LOC133807014 [Humulus lupulus]